LSFDLWYIEASEDVLECEETRTSIAVTETNNNPSRKTSATEQLVISTNTALALPPPSPTVPRDLWSNKVEFLLSVIGYVVDLGKCARRSFIDGIARRSIQGMSGDFLTCVMTTVVVPFLFHT
jgi:hypothetical protein